MTGMVVMIFRRFAFQKNPFRKSKELNKKNVHLENLTTKEMSTGLTVYYDGYGSYDCPKNLPPIKPLKEVKKKEIKKNGHLEILTTNIMSTG